MVVALSLTTAWWCTGAETTSKFAVIDIDWSNNKAHWANTPAADGRGMTCEEDMVKQANMIKAADPSKRVWVYRNIVSWLAAEKSQARWVRGSPMS